MAWKESSVMEKRVKLVSRYQDGDCTIQELADEFEVSRKTVYKWLDRFDREGPKGLEDRSRAPHSHPNAVAEEVERALLQIKSAKPHWGAPKLLRRLRDRFGELAPAESTVSAILRRYGLSRTRPRRQRAVPSVGPLQHCQQSNQVWCADFKGWFRTADGQKCTPLTVSDGYSRYLLCCHGLQESTATAAVQPIFVSLFQTFGMPQAIRTDNGSPFASTSLGGLTQLSIWWILLGIQLERIEPGHPEQNGRHERMHRTLKEATASPPKTNLRTQQQAFDGFRHEYNDERPHEALGQEVPGLFYHPSSREFPTRPPQQRGYPAEWEKRRVRQNGTIKWHSREIYISEALRDYEVGLEPVGDAKWAVHFEQLKLATFDERTSAIVAERRLQTNAKNES